ncbi:MAG: hypothetical protein AABZ58_03225 [Chloroflexota bacterium]|nr:hypothetical protein [Anaerolineales bacterium]
MQARRITVWMLSALIGLGGSAAIVFLLFHTDLTKYRIWFDGDLAAFQAIAIFGLVWIWLDYFLGTEMLPK